MSVPRACRVAAPLVLLFFVVAAVVAAPAPLPRREAPARPASLLGTWKQKSITYQSTDLTEANAPHKLHWVVKADTITIFSVGKQNRGSWTYQIDTSRSPVTLDLTVTGSRTTYPGIYKVEGDTLTVLLQNLPDQGQPRPSDFDQRTAVGVACYVFERVRSGEVE
jgi:uncharacterized protein (TIGR03067 family)